MVIFFLYAFRTRDRLLALFCGKELVGELVTDIKKGRRRVKAFLSLLAMAFGIGALTQPQWGYHWEEIKRLGVDIIVAIDVSESMLAEDVKPSRLKRAKREVFDLIENPTFDSKPHNFFLPLHQAPKPDLLPKLRRSVPR